jgi:hypothetical protein
LIFAEYIAVHDIAQLSRKVEESGGEFLTAGFGVFVKGDFKLEVAAHR